MICIIHYILNKIKIINNPRILHTQHIYIYMRPKIDISLYYSKKNSKKILKVLFMEIKLGGSFPGKVMS